MNNNRARIGIALLSVYLIWGSIYLAIKITLQSLPPLLMMGLRFLLASGVWFLYYKIRRTPFPTAKEWRNTALIGILMLGLGSGGTAFSEQWLPSGLAAVGIATVPLWTMLLALFWEKAPSKRDWLALFVGFAGVILLNFERDLGGNPFGILLILAAAASWALGSNLSRHLQVPKGGMGFACEMFAGGAFLTAAGIIRGEHLPPSVTSSSLLAWLYLLLFGSFVAFSAYMYLLKKTRVAVATSYAYVNPIIALFLGVVVAGEPISMWGILATATIVTSVLILSTAPSR